MQHQGTFIKDSILSHYAQVYMAANHQPFLMPCQDTNFFLQHQFFCHPLKVSVPTSKNPTSPLRAAEKNALYSEAL